MKGYLDMKAKGTLASKRCVQECHEWFPFTVAIVKEVLKSNESTSMYCQISWS